MPDHSFWGLHDFCKHYNMYKKKHGRLNSMCAIETAIRAKRQLLLHQNAILSSIYVFFLLSIAFWGQTHFLCHAKSPAEDMCKGHGAPHQNAYENPVVGERAR